MPAANSALSLAWSNPNAAKPQTGEDDGEGLTIAELRRQFTDYVTIKSRELDEQLLAWDYVNGKQLTPEQIEVMRARGQHPIIFNLVGKKVNGLVGVINRQRGEPKAFGRTEQGEPGAEIATQCVRYVLDASMFDVQDEQVTRQAIVGGIGVVEIQEKPGDMSQPQAGGAYGGIGHNGAPSVGGSDPDYRVEAADARTFFYDPKSLKPDFDDARFLGVSKMVEPDEIDELFPGMGDVVEGDAADADSTVIDAERADIWYGGVAGSRRTRTIRLVEHWYKSKGKWRCAFYAGMTMLWNGESPYLDECGKTIPRIMAFSANVDVDGTRYGFVRAMIGPQDAINQHRSKAVHVMNARQVWIDRSSLGDGAQDIETIRREVTRPDGVIIYNAASGIQPPKVEQFDQGFIQQTQYYQDAVNMIDQFGPNPATVASAGGDPFGRAMNIAMQAGMAELGGFLSARRGLKLRLYRCVWAQAQRNWTSERIIRVTRDENLSQYLTVNKLTVDEYGRPALVNVLGAIDVDIIMDEGPDTVNVMGDVFDILQSLAQNKVPIPPAAIIEASALPASQKQKLIGILNQPDPAKQAMQQATIAKTQGQAASLQADVVKKNADAQHSQALAQIDTMEAAHAHADRVVQAMHGGLDPQLPIDQLIQQRALQAQRQPAQGQPPQTASLQPQPQPQQAPMMPQAAQALPPQQ